MQVMWKSLPFYIENFFENPSVLNLTFHFVPILLSSTMNCCQVPVN